MITGYSAEDVDIFETLMQHPEGEKRSSFAELVEGGLARGEAVTVEIPLARRDGGNIWASIIGRAINPPTSTTKSYGLLTILRPGDRRKSNCVSVGVHLRPVRLRS